MLAMNRRSFMVGCSAAIASMSSAQLGQIAFGNAEQEPNQDIMLVIFLRGGIDGLSVVPVIDGPDREHYESARESIAIPTTGDNAALPLTDMFGLHPAAAPLLELYQDKNLAVVHAAGLNNDTRSHFDAMKMIELGTPGLKSTTSGWLTRHILTSSQASDNVVMPAVAIGNLQPTAFAGSRRAVGISSPKDFGFGGHWLYQDFQRSALRKMYGGDSWIHAAGLQTLDAIDTLELSNPGNYEPANGAEYPNGSLGNNLKSVAQMIKMQLGMTTATVDYGGWDTHEYQGNNATGYFASRIGTLAQAINAFYTDLSSSPTGANSGQRVTTIVMSEFGRSLKQNGSGGTDHGHGNIMLVIGDKVNGGNVYGEWPGLDTEQLYDNRDLAITTDYRQVLSEILIKRFANPSLGDIFPGYSDYQPLDFVEGTSLTPNYDAQLASPVPDRTNDSSGSGVYLPMIAN